MTNCYQHQGWHAGHCWHGGRCCRCDAPITDRLAELQRNAHGIREDFHDDTELDAALNRIEARLGDLTAKSKRRIMSETFTGKHGTAFSTSTSGMVYITRATSISGLQGFSMPLTDLLEFADSIERRETLPDKPDIVLRQQSDAWLAVWDQCVTLGMLDITSAVTQSGQERAVAFIAQLAIRAKQAEPPLSERTKLLAMMAATIASGYVATGTGEWDTDGVLVEAEAILEAIEKEARL